MENELLNEINEALDNPKSAKARISPFLSVDVVRALKAKAKSEGRPYNIVLDDILRSVLIDNSFESRLKKLEQEVFKSTGTEG
ncbi:MAG: hypothetical protein CME64_03740 [Halobacteriovoraceae bacterium]|nr:hypothetical protein [Halobacteriovoraceae bacterium]|tara:strand:- start:27682 stop:27930 length:249 start_codon:yes stop_codon:yes gene_type:complete